MSGSRTLALTTLLAAGLLTACSDATAPSPNFSCSETQGSNTVVSCPK